MYIQRFPFIYPDWLIIGAGLAFSSCVETSTLYSCFVCRSFQRLEKVGECRQRKSLLYLQLLGKAGRTMICKLVIFVFLCGETMEVATLFSFLFYLSFLFLVSNDIAFQLAWKLTILGQFVVKGLEIVEEGCQEMKLMLSFF